VLLGACAGSAGTGGEPAAAPPSTSPTTTVEPTTTAAPTTTTTEPTTTSSTLVTGPTTRSADGAVLITNDVPFTSSLNLDVLAPAEPGLYPVVVAFHGGGWVGGNPDDIAPLATAIAEAGVVVFNAPYRLALRGGGYPMSFEDAACAVRFAREYAAGFGGDPGFVTVVGYSAGAHIGAITALTGDSYSGDCVVESGNALPDGFVGVAGPYDTDLLDPFMGVFFGKDRADDPASWDDGNPHNHIGENPNLIVRLVHGELDIVAPIEFSILLNDDLAEAGYDVQLAVVEDGNHSSVVDPRSDGTLVVETVKTISG
jgi:acetyl esterase/lipase